MAGVFDDSVMSLILSWLPAKVISKFKCVSQKFSSLTSDRFFFLMQSLHAEEESGLLIQGRYPDCYELTFVDPFSGVPPNSLQFISERRYSRVVGSSNGLLVLCKDAERDKPHRLCIYNPVRQTWLPLPIPVEKGISDNDYYCRYYRHHPYNSVAFVPIAYDGIDYELIFLAHTLEWSSNIEYRTYSSREGKWTETVTVYAGPANINVEHPVISDGIVYLAAPEFSRLDAYVVAINVQEGCSIILGLPRLAKGSSIELARWGDESVSLIQLHEHRFTIWAMKKLQSKRECLWVQVLTVSLEEMGLNRQTLQAFSLVRGSTLVFVMDTLVYAYNLEDGKLQRLRGKGEHPIYMPTLFPYVNALRPCGRFEFEDNMKGGRDGE